ncbi:MAG: rRNA maturation RNase YbeY [Calditrichia bacterium]
MPVPRQKAKIQIISARQSESGEPGDIDENRYKQLIHTVQSVEEIPLKSLAVIFVDDEYLRNLHREYLNDDSYTDVMTFNLGEAAEIEGEIYISPERVKINAEKYRVQISDELARVIVHGLLHLKGYDDQTPRDRRQMRSKEDEILNAYWKIEPETFSKGIH